MLRLVSRKPAPFSARRQRGLTLVELVITIVVISIALYTSLQAFSYFAGRSADALNQTRMLDLAQLYLDEILAKRWDEATGSGGVPVYVGCRITNDDDGESRALFDDVDEFDDVDDYHNLSEQPALADQPLATLYADFTVNVQVSCDNSVGVNNNGAKRIELEIRSPQGDRARYALYRGNF